MKLISRNEEGLLFEISEVEDVFLRLVLSAFPIHRQGRPGGARSPIPADAAPPPDDSLLQDSLRDTKRAHKSRIETFLAAQPAAEPNSRLRPLRIAAEDVEWLLQVVNEIRIGSWYELGCPSEGEERNLTPDPESTPHVIRFDFSGWFLTVLLDALERS